MPKLPSPPSVGDLIDDGHLKLTHLLGQGGFSSVFRAEETSGQNPRTYAVKCLQPPQGRHLHLREASLHSLCSIHPSVVPLRKILFRDQYYTLLVMDYYPEGDLFAAILSRAVYLGRPHLIKSVFLQILNAVISCHEQTVFLRDLKPENILVADSGASVYLTDFGLATNDLHSSEFKTGSVYHMSPECMGPEPYSPQHNDIWSLGILLLNLVTSRNPWRSAHASDPTFAAYVSSLSRGSSSSLSDPDSFPLLPRILPIFEKLNSLLERILCINPAQRIPLRELRREVKKFGDTLDDWYSADVVFQGSCARCAWEVEGEDPANNDDMEYEEPLEASVTRAAEEAIRNTPPSSWSQDSFSPSIVYCSPAQSLSPSHSVDGCIHGTPEFQPLELEDIIHLTPSAEKNNRRTRRPHPIPTSSFSTPESGSGSLGSLDGPITPKDAAVFSNLRIVDPQAQSLIDEGREELVLESDTTAIGKGAGRGDGFLGPSFLPHRLFGRAAGLFSRN